MKTVFLRVDVDTYLGARDGVPAVLEALDRHGARATFFVTLGPDRWGRAIWRVIRRRGFLRKMLRTGAVRAYGLSTCLRGTLLPSAWIAERLGPALVRIRAAGHEAAPHAWDHVRWQDRLDGMAPEAIREEVAAAVRAFGEVFGEEARAWASPGWVTTPAALEVLDGFGWAWMSNTRGCAPYVPIAGARELRAIEIPVTLPTFDEVLGRDGVGEAEYDDRILGLLEAADPAVYTVHAETEGGRYRAAFEDLLARIRERGWRIAPLGELAGEAIARREELPRAEIVAGEIPGRAGMVSLQGRAVVGGSA
ncbi:MAG: 4-deoxy-4-formamido-L-arabinose-phosphoundecaprenol deformylase [Planctomycetes bacterium]|nr:4-deoxy-4-formamido-L-arabinose-phosphoundecaprenol deformylase [Planctomycetota bacterium]